MSIKDFQIAARPRRVEHLISMNVCLVRARHQMPRGDKLRNEGLTAVQIVIAGASAASKNSRSAERVLLRPDLRSAWFSEMFTPMYGRRLPFVARRVKDAWNARAA